MKKLITTLMIGSAMALTACANTTSEADYSYEANAPYASERTVGAKEEAAKPQAERVFESRQRK